MRGEGAYTAGRRAIRGRAILPHLEEHGVTVRVHAGKLVVTAEGRESAVSEVVDKAGRLLLGFLADQPVLCELEHANDRPEAWTVLVGGLAACQAHAEGSAA